MLALMLMLVLVLVRVRVRSHLVLMTHRVIEPACVPRRQGVRRQRRLAALALALLLVPTLLLVSYLLLLVSNLLCWC